MEKITEDFFIVSAIAEAVTAFYFFIKILRKILGADFNIHRKLCAKTCGRILLSLTLTCSVMQLSFGIFNSLTCLISPVIVGKDSAAASAAMILFNIFSLLTACLFYKIILRNISPNKSGIGNLTALAIYLFSVGLYINTAVFGNTSDSEKTAEIFKMGFPLLAVYVSGVAAFFTAIGISGRLSEVSFGAELIAKQAAQAEERLRETAFFRHDARYHTAVLSGLLKKGEHTRAEKYLYEISGIEKVLSKPYNTGCAAADVVLESKLAVCEKAGIKTECGLKLSEMGIGTAVFCGVLSNILENAVNACMDMESSSERFIRVSGGIQGNMLMIESENSFDGKAFQKGTGLMSVENTAKKYGGNVLIRCKGCVFSITVLMRLPQGITSVLN